MSSLSSLQRPLSTRSSLHRRLPLSPPPPPPPDRLCLRPPNPHHSRRLEIRALDAAQPLKRSTLFVDVLSVKEFPRSLLTQMLPLDFDILCTHPMFGPESGKDSWNKLPFVYEKVRIGTDESRISRSRSTRSWDTIHYSYNGDSFDLYYGLFMYNKNALEELERLDLAFESLKKELFGQLHDILRKQLFGKAEGSEGSEGLESQNN
ncbi:hypothetical protein C3L33_05429, partial [Rhododendron williamsianum]